MTSFSKCLPGGHIRFFGFWMAWFQQRNSSLLWNFSFKFHVHVVCGCRQKPNDCQLCRFHFKMAALWFWTMFNCNPPIAHCNPLLWGWGILVDHWSTISNFVYYFNCFFLRLIITCRLWVIYVREDNRPVSQNLIRAPPGGLSWTSGKLWQDYSNCYMFRT